MDDVDKDDDDTSTIVTEITETSQHEDQCQEKHGDKPVKEPTHYQDMLD